MNAEQRALGLKVLDHIEAHPEQHDQTSFGWRDECGTTACVAGWTIIFAEQQGMQINWGPNGGIGVLSTVHMPDGNCLVPFVAAWKLLGLEYDQAERLFYGMDEDQARAYLRELLDAAPVPS